MRLPIASAATVRRRTAEILREYRGAFTWVLALQIAVALVSLATPFLLGRLVDAVQAGTTLGYVNRISLLIVGAVLANAALSYFANRTAMVMGESVFASVRERLLTAVTHLPLSVVERAGTGDLLGRSTNDISRIQWMVRFGLPRVLVIVITVLITVGAAFFVSPLLSLALFACLPGAVAIMRWYLRRATLAYRATSAANSRMYGTVTETVEHADTVDALHLGQVRKAVTDKGITEMWELERYTLYLRIAVISQAAFSFYLPIVVTVLWGAYLFTHQWVSIGAITTIALYANQLRAPLGELMFWIDETQVAFASLARIYGVDEVEPDRRPTGAAPGDQVIEVRDVTYEYLPERPVLHGVSLTLRPGERLAVVGPSGSGKSTLARMLAGIHGPTTGSVQVGGVNLTDLPETELRRHVVLVTQEQHVFVGSVADNLRLARADASEAELEEALRAIGAWEWVAALPQGLATRVGSGARELPPGQAQELALARLVLLDPHTLILDEATSLLDPRAARSLEASLDAVLAGRTVVAIAHRLHTAHDADRVAVVMDGRIVELGTHDELVARGGEYAALWASWQHE